MNYFLRQTTDKGRRTTHDGQKVTHMSQPTVQIAQVGSKLQLDTGNEPYLSQ